MRGWGIERGRVAFLVLASSLLATAVSAQGFWGRRDWPTGAGPRAVAIADLSHDGTPDLAIANATAGTVSVFLGNPSGALTLLGPYPVGTGPRSIAAADLNGDGFVDLAVANEGSNDVSILLNSGGTSFSVSPITVGAAQQSIAAADLDGDGDIDLAVANSGANTVTLLLNGGTGTFSAGGTLAVGAAPSSVAIGDVDGDGDNDLVVANASDNSVSVLKNAGSGTFGAAVAFSAGTTPRCVAIADLDGNGSLDLAVANGASNNVSVLLNGGAGAFGAPFNYPAGTAPAFVAVADLDGDGNVDLAVANSGSNDVSVILNTGGGSFGAAVNYPVGNGGSPTAIAIGDLNGDGNPTGEKALDLAVVSNGPATTPPAPESPGVLSVLLNSGVGTYGSPVTVGSLAASSPTGAAIADMNGDGKLDVVLARYGTDRVAVLLNTGDGKLATPIDFAVRTNPTAVTVADLNKDGHLDLVVTNRIGTGYFVSVLLNTGTSPLQFAAPVDYAVQDDPISVAAGYLNGDDAVDLVVANAVSASVSVLLNLNNGTGALAAAVNYPVTSAHGVAIGDLKGDGDNKADIAFTDEGNGQVGVLLNAGDGTFGLPPTYYSVGGGPVAIAIGKLNADAADDIVAANANPLSNSVSVLLNRNTGAGTFFPAAPYAVGTNPTSVALGDLNGDGLTDVVVANSNTSDVSVLFNNGVNNGAVSLAAASQHHVGTGPSSVALGDINGDGVLDYVTANRGSGDATVGWGYRGCSIHAHGPSVFEFEGVATFVVHELGSSCGSPMVDYTTVDGTALAGQDYTAAPATTLIFGASDNKTKTVSVPITGDSLDEPDETFRLHLSPPWTALVLEQDAVATILDDDPGGVIDFAQTTYSVNEGAGTVAIQVRRQGGLAAGVTVDYQLTAGTATAGADFAATPGTVTFGDGQSTATVSVPIVADMLVEPDETFSVRLSNPSVGARLGRNRETRVTIVDNNAALTVARSGAAAAGGTVVSQPTGIACGADCSEVFSVGTGVTLTATPDPGVAFASWSGDCAGALPVCALTMAKPGRSATAAFSCSPIIAPGAANHDSAGARLDPAGSGIAVTTTGGCAWTASVTSGAAWLTVTAGSTGSGSGTVLYSMTTNNTTSQRVGIIRAAGHDFTVTQYPPRVTTTTQITSALPAGTLVVGQGVSVAFSVSPSSGSGVTPTGTVTVASGGDSCTGTLAGGTGTCTIALSSIGTKSLVATYSGDYTYFPSSSSAVSRTVTVAGTTTRITGDTPDPSFTGQPTTIRFTVAALPPGGGAPTGTVTVTAGPLSCIRTLVVADAGVGSCTISFATAGSRVLVASYAGDGNYTASTSGAESHKVYVSWEPQSVWHNWFAVDTLETPMVGDFNGDRLTDIITFTRQNPLAVGDVYVALSDGREFVDKAGVPNSSDKWHDWFAITTDETVVIGDYDGDGKDDIATWLGKTSRQVYVALSTGEGMMPESVWVNGIGFDPTDVIQAGDVNGDGLKDLVCFARKQGKVYVALSTGTSFQTPVVWHNFFAVSTYERPRVADVNGDGRADIVTFATDSPTAFGDVYVAVSDGTRFVDQSGVPNSSTKWHDFFSIDPKQQIRIGDINHDGKDDFFTFLPPPFAQSYTVLSLGTSMGENVLWPEAIAPLATDLPFVGDANGDGKADIVVFAQSEGKVYVSLGQ